MAFPAAYVRFWNRLTIFSAGCRDLHTVGEKRKGSFYGRFELHEFTGICPQNTRHGAVLTSIGLPWQGRNSSFEQPAFFTIFPPEIISKKKGTLNSSRVFHTRVMYSPVRVSIRIVSPASTKFGTKTSSPVEVVTALVTLVAVSPRTDGSALITF